MKKITTLLALLTFIHLGYTQNRVEGTEFTAFSIKETNDTIDFVIADTILNVKKPMLLFCQGSMPVPLFVNVEDERIIPLILGNFDLDEMKKHYHVVVISMPKTPMIAKYAELSEEYFYIGNSGRRNPTDEFSLADYSENYLRRAKLVIDYLKKKAFIDSSKLVVCGHSQGSRIAVGIAATNKEVTHLGLFGYSYERRIDGIIRKIRVQAENCEITWEEADSLQADRYEFYSRVLNDDSLKATPHLTSWKSFSKTSIIELAALKIPVYIANGSEDVGCAETDMIPLYFIEKGKTNYVFRRYPGLEHNFFPIVDGMPDYKNGEWVNVMNAFIQWTINN